MEQTASYNARLSKILFDQYRDGTPFTSEDLSKQLADPHEGGKASKFLHNIRKLGVIVTDGYVEGKGMKLIKYRVDKLQDLENYGHLKKLLKEDGLIIEKAKKPEPVEDPPTYVVIEEKKELLSERLFQIALEIQQLEVKVLDLAAEVQEVESSGSAVPVDEMTLHQMHGRVSNMLSELFKRAGK